MAKDVKKYAECGRNRLNNNLNCKNYYWDLYHGEICQLIDIKDEYRSCIDAMYHIAVTAYYFGFEAGNRAAENRIKREKRGKNNGKQKIRLHTEHK